MSTAERVIPLFVYADIQAAHDFLVAAFGFIWLHRVTNDHRLDSALRVDLAGGGLVVFVADVDAHCARARAAGARIDAEPTDQPYGQREYGARDPENHRWWFATPIIAPQPA